MFVYTSPFKKKKKGNNIKNLKINETDTRNGIQFQCFIFAYLPSRGIPFNR